MGTNFSLKISKIVRRPDGTRKADHCPETFIHSDHPETFIDNDQPYVYHQAAAQFSKFSMNNLVPMENVT